MSDKERIAVIRRTVENCIKYSLSSCTWGHEADIKFLLEQYDALVAEAKPQRCAALNPADPPQDCDAPFCGCNPEWSKCIEWLVEAGWQAPASKASGSGVDS